MLEAEPKESIMYLNKTINFLLSYHFKGVTRQVIASNIHPYRAYTLRIK